MRQSRKHTKPIIGGIGLIILIALAVLIMLAPTGAIMTNEQPATAVSQTSYIPNPVMNTNVTWSNFYNGWNPLEYSNGTGNATLQTDMSTFYQNPISINPTDIQSHALNWTSAIPKNLSAIQGSNLDYTATDTGLTIDTNSTAATHERIYWTIPSTSLPSNNPAYDYLTIEGKISGITQTGQVAQIGYQNSSVWQYYGVKNNSLSTSTNYITNGPFFASVNLAYLNLTASKTNQIGIKLSQPEGATSTFTVNVTGFNITETQLNLGIQNGKEVSASANGNAFMQTFNPNFAWQDITHGGYTVATSQSLQNTTESQSSISSGSFIEQATYQGTFYLPSAPDLTYSGTQIQMNMTVSGAQFEVANLNGISYLSTLSTKNNGTFVFGTANPQNQNSLILETEFTAAQWNASTTAPSFFSIQGIEYYWWVGVIGLLSIVGLGAAASSHFSGEEDNLKVPKGKFGR